MQRFVPRYECPKCEGTGRVPLSDELMMVLNAVKYKNIATAPAVKRILDPENAFHVSAFNNRLNMLRHMGFVSRVKRGRTWFYIATEKAKKRQ